MDKNIVYINHTIILKILLYPTRMFYIAATRFNNSTYEENISYRKKRETPVIYGTNIRIRNIYPIGAILFVVEMNNELNKIMGIGLIRNQQVISEKLIRIYSNNDYNRYIYGGNYWLSREIIATIDPEIVNVFDLILFKGKSHLKRISGISILTDKLMTNWRYDLPGIKDRVKRIFTTYFEKDIDIDIDIYENIMPTENNMDGVNVSIDTETL